MKRTLFAQLGRCVAIAGVAAALSSGCSLMHARSKSGGEAPSATTVYKLDNGMTVVLREDHFAPVAALQVWVKAGAADEREIEAGVAHVHEHMLFKGTERRAVGEVAGEIESAGGHINAWTSWDQTVYHIVVASRFVDTALDVLADAVRHSSFDPTELERELGVVLEEWKRGQDSPGQRIFKSLFGTAFTRHPYRRPVIGTEESIKGLTRERVLSFFHRFYTPQNMTLIVVGDFDTAHLREAIDRNLGDFEPRKVERPERPVEPPQDGLRLETVRMQVQEAHLALGFHVPSALDEDAPLLDMLAFVLGEGESSRLYRRLVAESQLATSASAFAYTPPDPGLMVVSASLEAADMVKAYRAVLEELSALRARPIDAEEMERARANLEADFVYRKETVQGQARELGYATVIHGDPDYDRRYLESVRSATRDDLLRVARKYLRADNLSVVELLPEGAAVALDEASAAEAAAVLDAAAAPAALKTAAPAEVHEPGADGARTAAADGAAATPGADARGRAGTNPAAEDATAAARHLPADGEPTITRLANGVRLIIAEHHDVPVFSIQAAMIGGLLAESPGTNGISNFTAEMLGRGTLRRDREQFARDVEAIAGSLHGFSGRNSLGVSGGFLSEHRQRGIELFLEALREPAFAPEEVEKARREILLAIKNRQDSPSRVAFDLAFRTVFPEHPYGMTTVGTRESVEALTAGDLRRFYQRALDPWQLVVAVVGDVDPDEILSTLGEQLAAIQPSAEPFRLPPPPARPSEPKRASFQIERHQSHVVLAFPGIDVKSPDRFALSVLTNILAGQSGRLFYELRDRQSLAYSVTAFTVNGLQPGLFAGYIATDPSNVEKSIDGMLAEFEKVREQPVEADELERAKRYLIGSRAISLQSNGANAEDMVFNELYGLGYLTGRSWAEKIDAVTDDDVRRVARKYLAPQLRAAITVGP